MKTLHIQPIIYLPCDICKNPVYDYIYCIKPFVYCSCDCFDILYLQYFSNFHTKNTFDDDLMILDY